MVTTHSEPSRLGRVLYGALFVLILPAALALWAWRLDAAIDWPLPAQRGLGAALAVAGVALVLAAMLDLLRRGQGLPMNAFPPARYVTGGVYAALRHPIYVGAVAAAAGVALFVQSPAGLYLATPLLAGLAAALVLGYERLATARRFGRALAKHDPQFDPLPADQVAPFGRRLGALLALGALLNAGALLIGAARGELPPPAVGVPFVVIGLWLLLTPKRARRVAISGAVAVLGSIYAYLVLPLFRPGIMASGWGYAVAALLLLIALAYAPLWRLLQRASQAVANSRHDRLFFDGRFRIINHALFAGLGGALGVGIGAVVTGSLAASVLLLVLAIVGSALFAQAWWGSKSLQRPYGYWGAILGGLVGIGLANWLFDVPLASIALACVLCAPFVQAIGRLRCLSQGCCHGVPTDERFGIRVWQKQSRVVILSKLEGQPILVTQLYSIGWNVLLGGLLWGLYLAQALPASLLVGLYLILTGVERFAEDGYRGETQTKVIRGLLESQWVAGAGLLVGVLLTLIASQPAAVTLAPITGRLVLSALAAGLIPAFAMGMDFPRANVRFARLSG